MTNETINPTKNHTDMTIPHLLLASAITLAATAPAAATVTAAPPTVQEIIDSAKAGAARVSIDSINNVVIISSPAEETAASEETAEETAVTAATGFNADYEYRMHQLATRERVLDQVLDTVMLISAFVFIPLLCIMLPLVVIYRYRRRMMLDKLKVVEQAIDHGYPLPESFFRSSHPGAGRQGATSAADAAQLNRALIFTGVGFGVLIFGLATGSSVFAGMTSIPLFIGIAKLVAYFMQRSQGEQQGQCTPPPYPTGSVSSEIPPVPPCYNPDQQAGCNAEQD